MSHEESVLRLAGPLALLKAQATTTFEFCAREAAQIFGGLAYTRGGQVMIPLQHACIAFVAHRYVMIIGRESGTIIP